MRKWKCWCSSDKCVNRCTGCRHKSLAVHMCLYNLVKQELSVVWLWVMCFGGLWMGAGEVCWCGELVFQRFLIHTNISDVTKALLFWTMKRMSFFPWKKQISCYLTVTFRLSDTRHFNQSELFFYVWHIWWLTTLFEQLPNLDDHL